MGTVDEIKERVINPRSLHIARVPRKTKEKFLLWANEEFEGDYGMLLKFLVDGLVNPDQVELRERLVELENRVARLETKPEEEKKGKVIRLLNGKEIGTGGKENE